MYDGSQEEGGDQNNLQGLISTNARCAFDVEGREGVWRTKGSHTQQHEKENVKRPEETDTCEDVRESQRRRGKENVRTTEEKPKERARSRGKNTNG